MISLSAILSALADDATTAGSISSDNLEISNTPNNIMKKLRGNNVENAAPSSRNLATLSTSSTSNPSGTGWVGLQAITAFFVIMAAVAFALFLRPISTNRSQYQPV